MALEMIDSVQEIFDAIEQEFGILLRNITS